MDSGGWLRRFFGSRSDFCFLAALLLARLGFKGQRAYSPRLHLLALWGPWLKKCQLCWPAGWLKHRLAQVVAPAVISMWSNLERGLLRESGHVGACRYFHILTYNPIQHNFSWQDSGLSHSHLNSFFWSCTVLIALREQKVRWGVIMDTCFINSGFAPQYLASWQWLFAL